VERKIANVGKSRKDKLSPSINLYWKSERRSVKRIKNKGWRKNED
jgi:hypothetical protein